MFGDFNFTSGFSQLANIDISQKFEQIKKDLEANISSHIDHDALAAFTGEGVKGAAEDGPASSQPAGIPVTDPGTGISPASLAASEQDATASTSQPRPEQSVSGPAHLTPTEPDGDGTAHAASPRQRSLRHPRSPRSPAAQRRANARSKPDAGERLSIRRLGAEPTGKRASMDSAAPLPVVVQTDDADRVRVSVASLDDSRQEPVPTAHGNGKEQHHHSLEPHEDQKQKTANPAEMASIFELGRDANGDTDGWEGDIEDGADHSHFEPLRDAASSPASQSGAAEERAHVLPSAEQELSADSATLEPPSTAVQQDSGDHIPPDPLPQSATHAEAAAGAQKQDTGLQLQAVRNLSASSVEKPGTPPRLASPKAPQPSNAAMADETARRDALADKPGSMAPHAEPLLQSPADIVKQDVTESRDVQPKRIDSLDLEAAQQLIVQLKASLQARELQLERNMQEVASLQDTMQQVMAKNEELARKSAAISEEDLDSVRAEFEARLGVADRKVYALTKERDALRRGADKLNSANDLVKEKDAIIQQVMEEGERLSKKQLAQENTIKKLRAELAELRSEKGSTSASLATERQKVEAAQAAKQKAEEQVGALRQSHKAEMEAEKSHYEALLQKARAAQVEAEQASRAAAKEGLGRRARDAEARAETLAETVEELRAGLERQRGAADYREDMLKRELADITRRGQAAEARHEELASAMPEATRPLLRQIEAMQAAAAAHSQAWAAAERSLTERLSAAEARAATSGEKERAANERAQAATSRQAALMAALDAAREEASDARRQGEDAQRLALEAQQHVRRLEEELVKVQAQLREATAAKQDAEAAVLKLRSAGEHSALAALAAAESRCADLEDRLRAAELTGPAAQLGPADKDSAGNGPPAMAGPGCRWVLVKEGEEPPSAPSRQNADRDAQAARRAGSHTTPLDKAMGPSGEGARLQELIRQRDEQIDSLQQQIMGLERTRDSLAEELVTAAQTVESGKGLERKLSSLHVEYTQVVQRLRSATELLGEKEERMAELAADVADMRQLYREQVEEFVGQLAEASQQSTPQPSPRPSASV